MRGSRVALIFAISTIAVAATWGIIASMAEPRS